MSNDSKPWLWPGFGSRAARLRGRLGPGMAEDYGGETWKRCTPGIGRGGGGPSARLGLGLTSPRADPCLFERDLVHRGGYDARNY